MAFMLIYFTASLKKKLCKKQSDLCLPSLEIGVYKVTQRSILSCRAREDIFP